MQWKADGWIEFVPAIRIATIRLGLKINARFLVPSSLKRNEGQYRQRVTHEGHEHPRKVHRIMFVPSRDLISCLERQTKGKIKQE